MLKVRFFVDGSTGHLIILDQLLACMFRWTKTIFNYYLLHSSSSKLDQVIVCELIRLSEKSQSESNVC